MKEKYTFELTPFEKLTLDRIIGRMLIIEDACTKIDSTTVYENHKKQLEAVKDVFNATQKGTADDYLRAFEQAKADFEADVEECGF